MSERQLIVTRLPFRKGWWLAIQDGAAIRSIAKFRNDTAMKAFTAFVVEHDGRTLRYTPREGE